MQTPRASPSTPVVIVGAGPTGLATALELARQGFAACIFDMTEGPNTESRGTGLQARTLELLDLYGVTELILARAHRVRAFIVYQSGEDIGRIDFTLAPSRFGGSPALPQAITEAILRDALAEAGVTVEYGVQVTAVEQHDGGCTVRAIGPDRQSFEISADWVVGADGARSPVRTMLDLPFDGVSYPEVWGLMDATVDWAWPPDACVPVPGAISEPTWRSAFRIHRRQVVAYRNGRILLAGDAAHIHTPAGAQGLNTGIQDGINLGWKLALVAGGAADAALLDTYEGERKPIAADVLHLTEVLARNPAAMLGDGSLLPEQLAARVGQLLVNYRDGPLAQSSPRKGGLVAGDRLPDVAIGGVPLYHRLRAGGVMVAVLGAQTDVSALAAEWGNRVPIWHVDRDDADGVLAKALGLPEGAVVIRPDAYLGVVVEGSAPAAAIDAWLKDALHLKSTAQAASPL
jgi:2-polyprenyl-6-methoxyphenol hydroxylase-like FAD-dependent oxidoreductase